MQRARILAAMFDVAAERGAANVTVAHVVDRCGVSRRTFYELFGDREDCFVAAFEQALAYAAARVLPAYESGTGWRDQIKAGLVALLSFLDEEPVIGRLLIVESLAGGAQTLRRRGEAIAVLTRVVERGRAESRGAVAPPALTGEGVVGGVLSVIDARLGGLDGIDGRLGRRGGIDGRLGRSSVAGSRLGKNAHAPLLGLTNQLMSMIVLPYLGVAAARRELARKAPKPSGNQQDEVLLSDPFKDAGIRLTYRTIRVLMAIAELGGRGISPSNRLVADAAEIKDQGQVSKLLARLQRLGMIDNVAGPPDKGAPNAWRLTEKGRAMQQAVEAPRGGVDEQ
jgi:AcrR family transcriptional regulator